MSKHLTFRNFITFFWVAIAIFVWPIATNWFGGDPLSIFDSDRSSRMPVVRYVNIAFWLYPIFVLLSLFGCYLVYNAQGKSWFGTLLVWLPLFSLFSILFFVFVAGSIY